MLKVDQPLFQWVDGIFTLIEGPIGLKKIDKKLAHFGPGHRFNRVSSAMGMDGSCEIGSAKRPSCQHEGMAAALLFTVKQVARRPNFAVGNDRNVQRVNDVLKASPMCGGAIGLGFCSGVHGQFVNAAQQRLLSDLFKLRVRVKAKAYFRCHRNCRWRGVSDR